MRVIGDKTVAQQPPLIAGPQAGIFAVLGLRSRQMSPVDTKGFLGRAQALPYPHPFNNFKYSLKRPGLAAVYKRFAKAAAICRYHWCKGG